MLKTPIDNQVTTTVTATLTASPKENAEASGGEEKEVVKPTPLIYTINEDSSNNIYIYIYKHGYIRMVKKIQ